ncbi:hypothetical protein DL93DRAFT_2223221 [Clavulina sp. PMI_390]|nr:hypothetical protein DL93DRAFT_2223221 [Clavulina sp. PMI_390]
MANASAFESASSFPLLPAAGAFRDFLHFLVPLHADRIPITPHNFPLLLLPPLVSFFLGGLARRRDTHYLRLALLLPSIVLLLHICFTYYFEDEFFRGLNHAKGAFAVCGVPFFLSVCLPPEGVLKMNEIAPGVVVPAAGEDGTKEESTLPTPIVSKENWSIFAILLDGLELLSNLRGIGYKHGTGTGIYVEPDWRDRTDRRRYLRQTVVTGLWWFLLVDSTNSILKHANVRVPGGTIFGRGRNFWESAIISTALAQLTAVCLGYCFNLMHLFYSFFAVFFRKDSDFPMEDEGWGPHFNQWWLATSLHHFWGIRWHQTARNLFLGIGGYPAGAAFRSVASLLPFPSSPKARAIVAKQAGNAGLLLGVFLASGLMHHWAFYASGPIIDRKTGEVINGGGMPGGGTIWYFTANAFGIGAEKLWRGVTGKPMGGWIGAIWTWIWIVGGAQILLNSWYSVGYQIGMYIPPVLSPSEHFLIPFLKQFEWFSRLEG